MSPDTLTESSVVITIVRGDRTIEVRDALYGDDLASEEETRSAIARLTDAAVKLL